jgi:hypothetical protein
MRGEAGGSEFRLALPPVEADGFVAYAVDAARLHPKVSRNPQTRKHFALALLSDIYIFDAAPNACVAAAALRLCAIAQRPAPTAVAELCFVQRGVRAALSCAALCTPAAHRTPRL